MISIINIGGGDASDPHGERNYEVRINRELITTFKHERCNGLARCLIEAGKAVEMHETKRLAAWVDEALTSECYDRICNGQLHSITHDPNSDQ